MSFYAQYPIIGGGGGVPIYANFAAFPPGTTPGQLAVAADTGILYEWNGSAWIPIAGPGSVLSLGNLDSQAATAQGAALVSNVLSMQSADATHPGLVNNTTQTLSGVKTFSSAPNLSSLTASLPLQLDGSKNITAALINLTSQVTGVLPVANGGSGTGTAFTSGSVIFADGSGVYAQNNAQFFWDNVNFFHGIGTNTPGAPLHIVQPNALVEMRLDFYSNTNPFSMFRANGTPAAPTQALTGDVLGGYAGFGANNATGFNTGPSARIRFLAAENQTNTSRGADIVFDAAAVAGGTGIPERMRLLNSGNLGIGLTTPGSKLTVKGTTTDSTASGLNVTDSASTSILFVRNDGRVGIGTTSPGYPLDIQSTGTVTLNMLAGGSGQARFFITSATGQNSFMQVGDGGTSSTWNVGVLGSSGAFQVQNNQSTLQAITTLGTAAGGPLVGIGPGATTPGAALDIKPANWTSNSANILLRSGGYTQTTSAGGTVNSWYFNQFLQNTITSGTSQTVASPATLYVQGAPLGTGSVTVTNGLGLYVAAGISSFGGNVGLGTVTPAQVLDVVGNIQLKSNLLMKGSSSGTFTQAPNSAVTDYTITWPAAQGAASTTIQNDGSGNLTWVAAAATGASSQSVAAQVNYVTNFGAETDTSGWATYANTAQATPVTGTGGSPNVTLTRSTSTPLRGTASFVFTKDAANRQGQGFSYDYTCDVADEVGLDVWEVSFDFNPSTYTNNGMGVYIYDKTNAALLATPQVPIIVNIPNNSQRYIYRFLPNSTSTSYRVIFHVQSTTASSWSMKFDNFYVGPSTLSNQTAYVRYNNTSLSFSSATTTVVNYATSDYAFPLAATTGAGWNYAVPWTGLWRVSAALSFTGVQWAIGDNTQLDVYVNTSFNQTLNRQKFPLANAGGTGGAFYNGSTAIYLKQSDAIAIEFTNGTGNTWTTTSVAGENYVNIESVSR